MYSSYIIFSNNSSCNNDYGIKLLTGEIQKHIKKISKEISNIDYEEDFNPDIEILRLK